MGTKYTLPVGTERQRFEVSGVTTAIFVSNVAQDYEEVIVPPAKPVPPQASERRIPVSELDPLARGSFPVPICIIK